MPLARIFTLSPERATALSQQLKKQGYTIDILKPGQTGAEPADLEIDLEICPQTEAFQRAIELASKLKADIAVAPGSIRFAPEPLVVPVDPAPAAPNPAAIELPAEPVVPAAVSIPEFAETARPVAPPPEAMPPREPARQPVFASSSPASEPPRPASPPLGERLSEAWQQSRPSLEKAAVAVEEWCKRAIAAGSATFSRVRERTGRGFAGLRESAESGSFSARQWMRSARERARLRAAESRARRQEQLLETEQRRAQAERDAAELRAAREAAAARLLQIRLEAGGQTQEQEVSRSASAGAEPVSRQLAPEDVFERRRTSRQIKVRRRYSSQLEAILTGVAAVSALFVIGLVVASFQPRSALSHGLDPSYKGATVQGGGVTLKPGPAKTKTVSPRPSPASKTSAARTKPLQGKPSPRPSAQNQNDVTVDDGQDVSVRHFRAPRKLPMQSAQQRDGMKRYSDLDN